MALSQRVIPFILTVDTLIFAAGDIIGDTQVIAGAFRAKNGNAILDHVAITDENNQGVAMTLLFFDANVSLGTVNQPPTISAVNVRNYLGRVAILATDWLTLGTMRVASFTNVGVHVRSEIDTQNLYVAVLNGAGTPTFTVNGLRLRLGLNDA